MVMKRTDPSHPARSAAGRTAGATGTRSCSTACADSSTSTASTSTRARADHYATVFQSHQAERAIRICAALIERVRHAQRIAHPIHIAFDEWNVWYRTRSHEDRVGGVEERYNLSDALAVATLPERLHPPLPHRAHRQLRPARERDRPDLHQPARACSSRRSITRCGSTPSTRREVALDVHVSGETYDLPPAQEDERRGPASTTWPTSARSRCSTPPATCDADGPQRHARGRQPGPRPRTSPPPSISAAPRRRGDVAVAEVNGPDVDGDQLVRAPRAPSTSASSRSRARRPALRARVPGALGERAALRDSAR